MRIDGSSLNPFRGLQPFGQKAQTGNGIPGVPSVAQEKESSGFNLKLNGYTPPAPPGLEGVFEHPGSVSKSASMTELVQETGAPESTSEAFALEMVRRMQGQTDENGEVKDSTALANALQNAVDWIADQHGEMTANAVMASVLGSTGDAASEQTVSNGLVKALEVIDANHGIASGDAAMVHFNGSLNRELNAYFDNGANEEFVAMTTDDAGTTLTNGTLSARFARQTTEAAYDDGDELSQTEKLLKELSEEMAEDLEETSAPESLAKAQVKKALEAYGFLAVPEPELLSVSA